MPTTEHTINDALAEALTATRRLWRTHGVISSETTGMLKNSTARPDILIIEPNVSPVVIETEVVPAATVENDAVQRLGSVIKSTGREILASIAVRLPYQLRSFSGEQLRTALTSAGDLEFALFTGDNESDASRWPHAGWLTGTVGDLSILAQSATVPPKVIEKATSDLVAGVSEAAGILDEIGASNPGAIHKVCEQLMQEDSEQTRRMAAAILANALVFHESLAGGPDKLQDVKSLAELSSSGMHKSAFLAEWKEILKLNYWPIFDIARRILEVLPASSAPRLLEVLTATAERLIENHLMRSHDLTGAVFQKLIADRKFLAAYYTTPGAASLLAGLSINEDCTPSAANWSSRTSLEQLHVADFACGTGTLLSTAYQRIGQLHELHGGDSEAIHPTMMESCLVGCDVLPAAAHLTASMLAGAHPQTEFSGSRIMTVAYGSQADGSVALGSVDLLDPQAHVSVLALTAKAAGGKGEEEKSTWAALPHETFDLVIMNPPFTRATGHEGSKIGVPNPMFAAFASDEAEQRAMAKATRRLTAGTSAHGNAGEASIFLVLSERMVKPGGTIAMVMPLSFVSGEAWEGSRDLFADKFDDLMLVSISGRNGAELSFSADTSIGECLIVGTRKKGDNQKRTKRATFIVLDKRPHFPMLGAQIARQIVSAIDKGMLRRLEDGPIGGTPLSFGEDLIGQAVDGPVPVDGSWGLSRISDLSVAQTAYQIVAHQRLWLPGMDSAIAASLPVDQVGNFAKIGPYHADIVGKTSNGGIRGPFELKALSGNGAPTFPILWAHDADRERSMVFEADSEGVHAHANSEEEHDLIAQRVQKVAATASHCHFNRDFRFNSQSTALQFTSRPTIGGRAWISIYGISEAQQKALVLFGNTSVGILLYWWHSNKQQAGRGSIGISALATFPTLNVTNLSQQQLDCAVTIFDQMADSRFSPANELSNDSSRALLDRRFFQEVIGTPETFTEVDGPLDILRQKLSREPSLIGHKKAHGG